MPLFPQTSRYVYHRCCQNLGRRQYATLSRPRWPKMRFQQVDAEGRPVNPEEKRKALNWKLLRSKILMGKEPRKVAYAVDAPEAEVQRPLGGRIRRRRAVRVRCIPQGEVARLGIHSRNEDESTGDLVPSAPSKLLGSMIKHAETSSKSAVPTAVPSIGKTLALKAHEHFNWYWETFPPTIQQMSRANSFFIKHQHPPRLLSSAALFRRVPDSDVPEVAFVGRSNVGKSSLLNAIVDANVKELVARTSATRGFTKTMNFYGIGPKTGVTLKKDTQGREKIVGQGGLVIVDMPGYGEGSLVSWGVEIMKYIQSRKQLRRVFVLLDTQHGIKDKDRALLASLRLAGVSHQVILSKMDKLYIPRATDIKQLNNKKLKPKGSVEMLRYAMEKLKPEIKPPVGGGALGELLACSGETLVDGRRLGINHVRFAVLKAVGLDQAPAAPRPEKHRVGSGEIHNLRKVKSGDVATVR